MSNTQPQIRLRQLAREFAEGRIDRESYRTRRAGLLDALSPSDKAAPASNTPASASATHSILPLAAAAGGLLLVAGAGLFLLFTAKDEPLAPAPAVPPETQPPTPMVESPPPPVIPETGAALATVLRGFVQAGDWSKESQEQLLQEWQSRGAQAQAEAKSSRWFRVLETDFRSRLEEERGLAAGSNGEIVKSLVDFGHRLELQNTTEKNTLPSASAPEVKSRPLPAPTERPVNHKTPAPSPTAPSRPVTAAAPKPKAAASTKAPIKQTLAKESVQQKIETQPRTPTSRKQRSSVEVPVPRGCRPRFTSPNQVQCQDSLQTGERGPWLTVLPGGLFVMGSDSEPQEQPVHLVNIAYPFAIATHEISYREYARFCRESGTVCPEQPWNRADLPVVNVSWDDAQRYTTWLAKQTGKGYRLPTEAEWEYAARAGSTGPYPVAEADLGSYAHYARHGGEDAPQASKPQRTNPNAFSLFHMAGNVQEWVLDNWHDDHAGAPADGSPHFDQSSDRRVVRGGGYNETAGSLRSSARSSLPQTRANRYTGFRVVRDIYLKPDQANLEKWGDWWLSRQDKQHYTVQLFSLKRLDRLGELVEHHPDLPLKLVSSNETGFNYRILYGLFTTKSAAENAFKALPASLRKQVPRLLIKEIGEL
ncbi:formylglycine-generating enzyme family protein [endosymbiont of Riftia pachyptila]|uniref:formylglycine-generating enzyme family protein n=1 Tax=endosymbiont of Riftia pachyptila TaxID=54396 RepID=UPI00031AA45A|nr:SUMF1/EgtB/PvdO family nonheme iron enzyme [endosymbiont of Riftia pachyptila]